MIEKPYLNAETVVLCKVRFVDAVKSERANFRFASGAVPRPFVFGTILGLFDVSRVVATGALVGGSRTKFSDVTNRVSSETSAVVSVLRGA